MSKKLSGLERLAGLVKVTIRLPEEVVQFGKAAAAAEGQDFQDLVDKALRFYFRARAQKTLADMGRRLSAQAIRDEKEGK